MFHKVQARAFTILGRKKLEYVADQIREEVNFDETAFQWEHINKLAFQFKLYLRPILSTVTFKSSPAQSRLIKSIDFLKIAYEKGKSLKQYPVHKVPTDFIPSNIERYIYRHEKHKKQSFIPDRYEFYTCRLLRDRLEVGDIYCPDSVKFRSF